MFRTSPVKFMSVAAGLLVLGTACGKDRKELGDFQFDPNYEGPALPWMGGDAAASDSDGDGLLDPLEEELGLDPLDPDSDGDGYDDGVEHNGVTDPNDPTDHPYKGGWAMGDCRHDVVPTGDNPGEITSNFELTDQYGDTVRLHDFCDRAVMLVTSAMWCGPCQAEAPELQEWYETYEDAGFMVITLLGEDNSGETSDQADLAEWADTYGLHHPVVSDGGWGVTSRFVPASFGIPTMHLLGPGAEVIAADAFLGTPDIEAALP